MDGVVVRRHEPGVTGAAAGADGMIGEIVLDRPDALNAIDTALARLLAQVCAELGADRQVRAVVLSAAGDRAFCAGADLKERTPRWPGL